MKIVALLLCCFLGAIAAPLVVTIHYGSSIPDKVVETTYSQGLSALDALKQVSTVETSQTGGFLFVRAIDGVRSDIGKFGWFYLIDGQKAGVTADHYRLKDARTMTWYYGVEACY